MLAQITSETAYKSDTIRVEGGEMRPDPFMEPGKSEASQYQDISKNDSIF